MNITDEIRSRYGDYRFNKIRNLEMTLNQYQNAIKSNHSSSERFNVNKKVPLMFLPTLLSIGKNVEYNVKSLQNNPDIPKTVASLDFIHKFEDYTLSLGIKSIGYSNVPPEFIFKDRAILYGNAIVLTKEIDKKALDNDIPQKQGKDLKLYDEFGKKTNQLADYLRDNGFGAQASHPAVGFVRYPILAQHAGLGWKGKSNLLITPELGPRQKISAIFTSIENLPLKEENEHSWIADYCKNCRKCIKSCPESAIVERESSQGQKETEFVPELCIGCKDICTTCMKECPFNKKGYSLIKKRFEKFKTVNDTLRFKKNG